MTATDTSPKFGNKLAYVQKAGVILTLLPTAPINRSQIIVEKVEIVGDGIAIHVPFGKCFLMNSAQALVDVVDWDWMEENTILD